MKWNNNSREIEKINNSIEMFRTGAGTGILVAIFMSATVHVVANCPEKHKTLLA